MVINFEGFIYNFGFGSGAIRKLTPTPGLVCAVLGIIYTPSACHLKSPNSTGRDFPGSPVHLQQPLVI